MQPRRHPPQARVQPRRGPLDRPDAPGRTPRPPGSPALHGPPRPPQPSRRRSAPAGRPPGAEAPGSSRIDAPREPCDTLNVQPPGGPCKRPNRSKLTPAGRRGPRRRSSPSSPPKLKPAGTTRPLSGSSSRASPATTMASTTSRARPSPRPSPRSPAPSGTPSSQPPSSTCAPRTATRCPRGPRRPSAS